MNQGSVVVGIDLGTTFSLVGAFLGGRPVVLPNVLGERLTPSAVAVEPDGTVLVGAAARARATTRPSHVALAFKRDMGTPHTWTLGGRAFRPADLSALVLAELKRDAETALGTCVEEAVITVPAYFGDAQRQATRDAGEIAGLRVRRIVNEPTAAALAYGLDQVGREGRVVVIDLGGGTFDVTVLELLDGLVEIRATAGDARLGGEDFTDALASLVAQRLSAEISADVAADPITRARLRDTCELAKRRLTTDRSAACIVPRARVGPDREQDLAVTITRDDAESAWRPILERMRLPIARALRDARIEARALDEVLVVGGATRVPSVLDFVTRLFGRAPLQTLPPDEAVALGAAVQAALVARDAAIQDVVVTDVAPFTLGIAAVKSFGHTEVPGTFLPVIDRGTTIPCSRTKRLYTMRPGQTRLKVEVFQGEHSMCSDNTLLGSYVVGDIPSRSQEEPVDIRFTYDLNGILEVESTVVSTGKTSVLVLERTPGRLSVEEVARATEAMKGLKLHPRDALPNTTAIARAEALFAELVGPERELLGDALQTFRGALETQDRRLVEGIREQLVVLTAQLR
jgi:molecular chaperone HscC